ncbi:MAG: hypothetical protein HYZ81_01985, partial [Nitrospinae bacterium]|nr:hypothetical protein [Nitrospinota bacterium]
QQKSFLQEQSDARKALVQMPEGGVFDGAALFSPAEVEGLRGAIGGARRKHLRVYVTTTQNAGVAHTLAKSLLEQLQRDDQDVVIVTGQDRIAAWAARLDQTHIADQIRQTSHARAQGMSEGTRALVERLAAAQASQTTRKTLLWSVGGLAVLGGAAAALLLWIGRRRATVAAHTHELNRIYDRAADVGHLLEEVELEARFQPDNERVHRLIQTARERYLTTTAQFDQVRGGAPSDPSTGLPALSRALEEAQDGLEKARRLLQGPSSTSQDPIPLDAPPPKALGDRAFSPRRPRDER